MYIYFVIRNLTIEDVTKNNWQLPGDILEDWFP